MNNEPPADDSANGPRQIPTSRPEEPPALDDLSLRPAGAGKAADWRAAAAELLRNRIIIGGLGVVAVLLLVAIVLVVVGESRGGIDTTSGVSSTEVPDGSSTVVATRGLAGQVNATATVRRGPDSTYTPLGTIPQDTVVSVVGRSEDDLWLQIVYPPGSELLGWIQAALVDVEGDVGELNVAGPAEGPDVSVPTSVVPIVTQPPLVPSATPPDTATPTDVPPTRTPQPTRTEVPSSTPRPSATATSEAPPTATAEPEDE